MQIGSKEIEILKKNYASLISSYFCFEKVIVNENSGFPLLLQNFLRFSEILINIFFRIIEQQNYGEIEPEELSCVHRMIEQNVVPDSKLWPDFLKIKNDVFVLLEQEENAAVLEVLKTRIYPFSKEIIKSIAKYLNL